MGRVGSLNTVTRSKCGWCTVVTTDVHQRWVLTTQAYLAWDKYAFEDKHGLCVPKWSMATWSFSRDNRRKWNLIFKMRSSENVLFSQGDKLERLSELFTQGWEALMKPGFYFKYSELCPSILPIKLLCPLFFIFFHIFWIWIKWILVIF